MEEKIIQYFETFEEREAAFHSTVGGLIPARHAGVQRFYADFRQACHLTSRGAFDPGGTCITANPKDGFAFGTVWQVLAAATMTGSQEKSKKVSSVLKAAQEFGLEDNLHQPIRSLSGGEAVKLALSKASLLLESGRGLFVASPFTWLSETSRHLLGRVLSDYREKGLPVKIFSLSGEDTASPVTDEESGTGGFEPACFDLHIKGLSINIGMPFNPLKDFSTSASFSDLSERLKSPCLITGENGQGKSLLAKALSGAVSIRGKAFCINDRGDLRKPRLLFQDIISQTMLRPLERIIESAGGESEKKKARMIIESLIKVIDRENISSLLHIKVILAAVRLASNPGAIILDEPDWGLNRREAILFVTGVIKIAHAQGIPVLLISHKPWWTSIAGSILRLIKARAKDNTMHMKIKREL